MNRKGFCSCLALDMSLLSHLLSFFSCSVSFLFFLVPNGLLLLLSPCCLFCLSISFSCLSELACASATSALISLCLCIYLHFIFHSCCAFICLLMLSRLNVLVWLDIACLFASFRTALSLRSFALCSYCCLVVCILSPFSLYVFFFRKRLWTCCTCINLSSRSSPFSFSFSSPFQVRVLTWMLLLAPLSSTFIHPFLLWKWLQENHVSRERKEGERRKQWS